MSSELLQTIEMDEIRCEEQVRKAMDGESLTSLAQTLRETGLLQPIRVRPAGSEFIIIDGERRFRAAQSLGWKRITAVVVQTELKCASVIQQQLIANCQREDLNPIDKARSIAAYMKEMDRSATQAAVELGFSNAQTTRFLRLLELPTELQERVAKGEISASAGYQLSRVEDGERQTQLAAEVAAGALTRDGVTAKVRRGKRKPQEGSCPARVTAQLGGGRSITISGPGLSGIEVALDWLCELTNQARKARTQNLALTTFIRTLRDRAKGDK